MPPPTLPNTWRRLLVMADRPAGCSPAEAVAATYARTCQPAVKARTFGGYFLRMRVLGWVRGVRAPGVAGPRYYTTAAGRARLYADAAADRRYADLAAAQVALDWAAARTRPPARPFPRLAAYDPDPPGGDP